MQKSESIKELASALAKAQAKFPIIPKNKKVSMTLKSGRSLNYSYAELAEIISLVTPVLSAEGLAISQDPTLFDGKKVLATTLMHSSGEWKTAFYPMKEKETLQDEGGELTYRRRYALCAALGIQSDDDADGAQEKSEPSKPLRPAAVISSPSAAIPRGGPSEPQLKRFYAMTQKLMKEYGQSEASIAEIMRGLIGKAVKSSELTVDQYKKVTDAFQAMIDKGPA